MSHGNHFNLLRMAAALAVLVSHSFPLALGHEAVEPLMASLGMTLGTVAVGVFFAISGYLVTASLQRRPSVADFVRARIRRIYPALWVAIALTTFALGPFITTLSLTDYLTNPRTWFYLVKNSIMLTGFVDRLPDSFNTVPYAGVVNGSLWTLPIEIRLYVVLALCYSAMCKWLSPPAARRWMGPFVVCTALVSITMVGIKGEDATSGTRFTALFFLGASLQWYPRLLVRKARAVVLCVLALAVGCVTPHAFALAFVTAGGYLVLCLAQLRCAPLGAYNRLGDYSYGLYIYAFPVQQVVAWTHPGIGVGELFGLSAVVTLALAVLSWHVVESPILRARRTASVEGRVPHAA